MLNNIVEFVRGIVRPILTVLAFASAVIMILAGIVVPEWYQNLVLTIIFWWFATRTANRGGR